jgi:tRNA G18 (ribose-2'-O)-methylase SpoU
MPCESEEVVAFFKIASRKQKTDESTPRGVPLIVAQELMTDQGNTITVCRGASATGAPE